MAAAIRLSQQHSCSFYARWGSSRSSVIKSPRSLFWNMAQFGQQSADGRAQFFDFGRRQVGLERRLDPVGEPQDHRPPAMPEQSVVSETDADQVAGRDEGDEPLNKAGAIDQPRRWRGALRLGG